MEALSPARRPIPRGSHASLQDKSCSAMQRSTEGQGPYTELGTTLTAQNGATLDGFRLGPPRGDNWQTAVLKASAGASRQHGRTAGHGNGGDLTIGGSDRTSGRAPSRGDLTIIGGRG